MSNNTYFRLYRDEIIDFARTLVVKCTGSAETLNRELSAIGVEVKESQPETWKYYLNLAGEYHNTDIPMTVRSIDTLEEIAFTKDNLRIHRATFREYQFGTRYYMELTRRYPNQVALINGILSPVDIAKAIDADDGELLYYDPTFLEPNETNVIPRLQQWLYAYFARWYNIQYALTDDLYIPSFLGVMYVNLPYVVQLIRLRNAKTPQAHSFHVREYLASNGRLDQYLPFLNKFQQLYLYRNLRYINRNVGKQEIFDNLVENILTKRGLPLAAYKFQHNTEEMPDSIYPEVELAKYPLNFGYNQSGRDTTSVHTILNRERDIARENAVVQYDAELEITEAVESSQFSSLPTKVLESEVVDRSNSSVRSLGSILLYEWLYLATHNRYNAFVNVPNPGTGQYMSMSVRDAFIVGLWAFNKARGIEFDTIPRVIAYDVLRDPLPSHSELVSIVDRKYVPEGMIQAIRDRITPLGSYITTEKFFNDCANLHREYLKLWELYSFQEQYMNRGMAEQLVRRHFMHIKCNLVDEVISFEQWFKEKGYGVADLSPLDLEQLYVDCVKTSTGADLVNRMTLSELQKALLGLMRQLSSYSVQYLRNINEEDFWYIGMPVIRLGDIWGEEASRFRTPVSRITANRVGLKTQTHLDTDQIINEPSLSWDAHIEPHYHVDPTVGMWLKQTELGRVKLNVANVGVRAMSFVVDHDDPDTNDLGHYQYPES